MAMYRLFSSSVKSEVSLLALLLRRRRRQRLGDDSSLLLWSLDETVDTVSESGLVLRERLRFFFFTAAGV